MGRRYETVDQYAGARLRRRRLALGLTHPALARAVGSTCRQIAEFESGQVSPSAGLLYEMALALGVRPEYFFADIPGDMLNVAPPPAPNAAAGPGSRSDQSKTRP